MPGRANPSRHWCRNRQPGVQQTALDLWLYIYRSPASAQHDWCVGVQSYTRALARNLMRPELSWHAGADGCYSRFTALVTSR